MAMLTVTVLCLLFIGWLLGKPYYTDYRRNRLRNQPFPAQWQAILQRRVPCFRLLPDDLRTQLQQHIQIFLAEKKFLGCGGLTITDEIRLTIAAQACLLILNRKTDYYPQLERILVYPSAFVVHKQEADDAGVLSTYRDELAGESWGDGQVIFSWEDTIDSTRHFGDGVNVVIHEFAHQLDQEKGIATGAPILASDQLYRSWSEAFSAEFDTLQQQAQAGEETLLDAYGAEHPAEFFAVASELFFEQPYAMAQRHPGLYAQLRGFYRVDPASWRDAPAD